MVDRTYFRIYHVSMYTPEIEQILKNIADKRIMVLATSQKDRVTARNMSVLVDYDKIYCQTDELMEKCRAIKTNANAAYCVESYQIYGTARIIGTWSELPQLKEKYIKIHKSSYERYENLKTEVVIGFQIEKIELWEYENGIPYIIKADLLQNTYKKTEFKVE